jgi:hypothetical protein
MTTLRRRDWTLLASRGRWRRAAYLVQLQKILLLLGERQKFGDFRAALAP